MLNPLVPNGQKRPPITSRKVQSRGAALSMLRGQHTNDREGQRHDEYAPAWAKRQRTYELSLPRTPKRLNHAHGRIRCGKCQSSISAWHRGTRASWPKSITGCDRSCSSAIRTSTARRATVAFARCFRDLEDHPWRQRTRTIPVSCIYKSLMRRMIVMEKRLAHRCGPARDAAGGWCLR